MSAVEHIRKTKAGFQGEDVPFEERMDNLIRFRGRFVVPDEDYKHENRVKEQTCLSRGSSFCVCHSILKAHSYWKQGKREGDNFGGAIITSRGTLTAEPPS